MKKEIISLLKKTITDNNISDNDNSYSTPPVNGKVITCDKNYQNLFVFSIRNSKLNPIYNITEEGDIFNKKGKEIKNRFTINHIYKNIVHIAKKLHPRH